MIPMSEAIEDVVNKAIEYFDDTVFLEATSEFEKLISFGELVDRLSIVNFKLYRLKDRVIDNSLSDKDKRLASIADVRLCEERSRLKTCIDNKLIAMIGREIYEDGINEFNPEVKKYGK